MLLKKGDLSLYDYVCIGILYILAFVSFSTSYSVVLNIAIPAAFVISIIGSKKILFDKYLKLILLFYFWSCFTAFFATFIQASLNQMYKYFVCFVFLYIIQNESKNLTSIKLLYGVWIIFFLASLVYSYNILSSGFDITSERLNTSLLNSNLLGYFTFLSTFSIFVLGEIVEYSIIRRFLRLVFPFTIVISFYAAIYTASRQILIIQFPFILLLLYIRYLFGKSGVKKFVNIILFSLLVVIALFYIYDTYGDSNLFKRIELNIEEDSRMVLAKDAFEIGLSHPLTGVGPGNFEYVSGDNVFSHNSYLEAFANSGFIGAFLFFVPLFIFVKRQYNRYMKCKSSTMYLVFLVFGVIYIFYNNFYVFYLNPWLYAFFLLVAMHSEVYYKMNSLN